MVFLLYSILLPSKFRLILPFTKEIWTLLCFSLAMVSDQDWSSELVLRKVGPGSNEKPPHCRINPLRNSGYTPSWQLRLRRTDTGRMDDANYENFYERERVTKYPSVTCVNGLPWTARLVQKIQNNVKNTWSDENFLVKFSMICHL